MGYGSISFGQLHDQKAFEREDYQKWVASIDIKELTKSLVVKLSNEIATMFSVDRITVAEKWLSISWDTRPIIVPFDNAGMFGHNGRLVYNPQFLSRVAFVCGKDALMGILTHEVGHRIVYTHLISQGRAVSLWGNELCSDFIVGLVFRLCDLSKKSMEIFYLNFGFQPSPSHPDGLTRVSSLNRGWTWIDRDSRGQCLQPNLLRRYMDTRKVFTVGVLQELFENEVLQGHL